MPTGTGFTWDFAWNELIGGFNAFIGLVNVPMAFTLALLLVGAVAVMGGIGGKGSKNKDKKGRAGGHEAWYQFFFGGVENLSFFYWLTGAGSSSNSLLSSGKGGGAVDLSHQPHLKVKFESDQNKNVFARIGKEKAIPHKQHWKEPHPQPKSGEWWKVEVVGKTRDGSKFLLKPVERGKRGLGRFF